MFRRNVANWILGGDENTINRGYMWNMIASAINAAEAIVILTVATRIVGLEYAGMLTISFSLANNMMIIAKYGMRNFQVTDTTEKYSFIDYHKSRIVSMTIMIVILLLYEIFSIIFKNYSIEKVLITVLVVLIYGIEAYEDVYISELQRRERLDIGAKIFSIRWCITLLTWSIGIFAIGSLIWATLVALIIDLIAMILLLNIVSENINCVTNENSHKVYWLLKECFPLCISGFLVMYLPNASKYAIDGILSERYQAIYGFISMPIFVIDVLSFVIFQPMNASMARAWKNKEYRKWKNKIVVLCEIIFVLSLLVLVAGYLLGIPFLSWLYATKLDEYKVELMMLLFAGVALAYISLFLSLLTIIRKQTFVMLSCMLMSVIAYITLRFMVVEYGVMGASIGTMCLMWLFAVFYGTGIIVLTSKAQREKLSEES